MLQSFKPYQKKLLSPSFLEFYQPIVDITPEVPLLKSRGHRPLKITFDDQLKMLIYYHLEEHVSARHMLQVLEQDDLARENIARKTALRKAAFPRPSTQGALSSSNSYLINSAKKHPAYCPIDSLNSAILLLSMAH